VFEALKLRWPRAPRLAASVSDSLSFIALAGRNSDIYIFVRLLDEVAVATALQGIIYSQDVVFFCHRLLAVGVVL
jgi:hypothetical protein